MLGRMDPFVLLSVPRNKIKTDVIQNGDVAPQFNYKAMLLVGISDTMTVTVEHQGGLGGDTVIGKVLLPLGALLNGLVLE
jgi:hypothetical protein